MRLSELKLAEYNPREMTDKAFEGLKFSLDEFGDISGIVFNERTGNLVAGHQRVKALQEKYCDLDLSYSEDGSASFVTPDGNIFKVRIVDWDIKKEKAANIAANNPKIQGEFTPEVKLIINELTLEIPDISNALLLNQIEIPIPSNDKLVNIVNNQDEWIGLPRYEDGTEPYKLVVSFENEIDRNEFLELINVKDFSSKNGKTLSMRWPFREKDDISSLRFELHDDSQT